MQQDPLNIMTTCMNAKQIQHMHELPQRPSSENYDMESKTKEIAQTSQKFASHSISSSLSYVTMKNESGGGKLQTASHESLPSKRICVKSSVKTDGMPSVSASHINTTPGESVITEGMLSDVSVMTRNGSGRANEAEAEALVEDDGRERLKRHRNEMAGSVWIPDTWGQEDLLKDWIDCTSFDASLINNNIMSARAALVEEGTTTNSSRLLRVQNSC